MPQLVGKEIGSTGYGLMGLTWRPQPQPKEASFKAMKAALEAGCNFWNGGELYGTADFNSLHLLEEYFTKYPEDAEKVVLSIKGGLNNMMPDGSPEGVRKSMDNCLKILNGKKSLDIFEYARVDPKVPIETTLKTLDEEYVKTGKLGAIGLSEVSAATIERAIKVTKIAAVEVEVSLWSMDIFQNGVAETCAKHGIPIAAYSPIGRGMLSGEIKKPEDIPEGDFRRHMPRFQPGTFDKNLELVKELEKIAKQKGCTPAQLAIGWVKHFSEKDGNPTIIPIPGATTEARISENSKDVSLTTQEEAEINEILKSFPIEGGRYGGPGAQLMNG
ncbi:Pyridoxal reductase [Hyphodiscus hymeniophilus]|uniref:Pyridoxal reductase n=1 Tax=Hyphodiscus hymeniophilus TaxID=353542 RepID=A0A9P7AXS7_9HELO|nr:Pyridoxal reductase [Hyphodiscus hymeniophilus]